MKRFKNKWVLVLAAFILSLCIIGFNHIAFEKSLHVHSPFAVSPLKFILMGVFYSGTSTLALYIFFRSMVNVRLAIKDRVLRSTILKKNQIVFFALILALILKALLYVAIFTGIYFLAAISMEFNLHMDWYFGGEPNHVYHFLAFEIIFLLIYGIFAVVRKVRTPHVA